jgi:hypothetical protein
MGTPATRVADAEAIQRESMRVAHSAGTLFVAYVDAGGCQVTTWHGTVLGEVTRHGSNSAGFGGSARHDYTVRDVHGNMWHGHNAGPGLAIRLRPSKH